MRAFLMSINTFSIIICGGVLQTLLGLPTQPYFHLIGGSFRKWPKSCVGRKLKNRLCAFLKNFLTHIELLHSILTHIELLSSISHFRSLVFYFDGSIFHHLFLFSSDLIDFLWMFILDFCLYLSCLFVLWILSILNS